ncbi:MAG TPA: ferredoxin [Rhodospirillaceae bacterium]|nr:MAG: ferredoxin [Alphaproteobacteria bacterium GWF2_58_20]HAU29403.1 ferredoxin [Rhodospirillaceae bacterium]
MPHVVTEKCIKCKYTECVESCPVSCFHEGQNMVVIDPDTCIDCGVCETTCPIGACVADSDPQAAAFADLNREYAAKWPSISSKKAPFDDADAWKDVPNKAKDHFSPEPGEGA